MFLVNKKCKKNIVGNEARNVAKGKIVESLAKAPQIGSAWR